MNWQKVRAVSRFEFLSVARRWSYLLATFALPAFLVIVSGTIFGIQTYVLQKRIAEKTVFGLVDEAGLIKKEAALDAPVEFDRFDTRSDGVTALNEERIVGLYVIEKDYLDTATIRVFRRDSAPVFNVQGTSAEPALSRLISRALLAGRVPDDVSARILEPARFVRSSVDASGAIQDERVVDLIARTLIPLLLGILLLTALLSSSGYLVQTIATDKETKVVEVLLAAAAPEEILTGKLLGLGLAGLIQFAVWSGMVVFVAVLGAAVSSLPVPWTAVAVAPLFFVMGYLFIGSLMLCTASLGSNAAESQKLTMGWAVLALLPVMLLVVLVDEPHGFVGQLFTWVPFTSPLTVTLRLAVDPTGISLFEIAGSLLALVFATWVAIRLGARLFRVGFILTDSRPSLGELWRQARLLK